MHIHKYCNSSLEHSFIGMLALHIPRNHSELLRQVGDIPISSSGDLGLKSWAEASRPNWESSYSHEDMGVMI
jgi:hypothetical protein